MQTPDHATTDYTATQITAVSAATMPLWLHVMSDWAQVILPLIGVMVLLVQAGAWLYKTFIRKPKKP
jgi:hypothetical protein